MQVKQLEVVEKHLEEAKGAQQLLSAIIFTVEELVEQVAQLEREQKWKWRSKEHIRKEWKQKCK